MNLLTTNIKKRENPNDVFITPINLVKQHINFVKEHINKDTILYDPFYGTGNYFNTLMDMYPDNKIYFTEISLGKDFFDFNEKIDIAISNPPYSMIDKVFKKSCELKPSIISYLIGFMNVTAKRIEYMNNQGYFIESIHLTKVYKWFGMSCIITFSNLIKSNCISFDRIVHK